MRLRRYLIFGFTALIVMLGSASSFGYDDPTPHGRVSIVYEDDNIQPENRDVVKKIRAAGLFERMADRLTAAVALPHDLEVVVTDNLGATVGGPKPSRSNGMSSVQVERNSGQSTRATTSQTD